jgi:hypothetical protein
VTNIQNHVQDHVPDRSKQSPQDPPVDYCETWRSSDPDESVKNHLLDGACDIFNSGKMSTDKDDRQTKESTVSSSDRQIPERDGMAQNKLR